MALHTTPEDHAADPPSAWQVVKVADRCWHLKSSHGHVFGSSYKTRRAAEQDKVTGFYVNLYEKEGRWYAGHTPDGWRSWAEVKAERERRAAKAAASA